MKLEALPIATLEGLLDRLGDLRHDLGKYIRFETRFVEDSGDVEALRAALRADLLSTRRRGDEVEAAAAVWARMRPGELDGDPDVLVIDEAMATLGGLDLDGPAAGLHLASEATGRVSEATRRLLARARARVGEN